MPEDTMQSEGHYVVQRVHHLDAETTPRFAALRTAMVDSNGRRHEGCDGDKEVLLPGLGS